MSNVSLKKVCKSYDNKKSIINNIDLEIADKEFIVLVGASGCGKSTILRMIAGLEEISGGELYIGDKKASFSIVEVNKDILIDSDDKYNLVLLKTKASLNDGEIVELTFKDKRISLFTIFDVIWKGWVMEKVNNLELQKITGGVSALALVGIAALIIFISGVLDGFTNPGRCNGWRRKVIWT